MIDNKKIQRINELSKIAKERELTQEETEERQQLRQEYVKAYKENVKNHLLNVKVVDPKGNDITPEKLKKAKAERTKS